jgi:two-component system, NtrC family, response regulator AtoC
VVVVGDAVSVTPLPARGTVTLGRDEDCEVRIDSRSVSRRHAVLHLGSPLRIEDLGSANGTFVRDPRSPTDTASTHPLRRLSGESLEIPVGERVSLGAIPIVVRRVASALHDPTTPAHIVVRDPVMRALYEQVTRAARGDLSVLILGETGVGKEVVARAVHDQSRRARKRYLALNCSALAPALLEAELFGHEKGSFTGATLAREGLLETADGGTVFLDEVGELPVHVQVKLLRVLDEKKVWRLGGRAPLDLDIRFIAATNRDLQAEVTRGTFRKDFYHRLNGLEIVIPPLRQRTAEIGPLAEHFLAVETRRYDRTRSFQLSPEALGYLERHDWEGNVRELRNVIERAAALSTGDVITPADLPGNLTGVARGTAPRAAVLPPEGATAGTAAGAADGKPWTPAEIEERERIVQALEQHAGNQTRAAKHLGMPLRTLVNRLKKYGISRPREPQQ